MRLLASLFFITTIAIAGCSDYVHCHEVCSRKQECVDQSLDVTKCAQSCSDRADNDQSYARQVDSCAACTDKRSCADDIQCAADCSAVP